jgi:putative addiction module component (TIGR02574 family)
MNKALLKELLELPPAERLEIVEELWDSIPPQDLPSLTDEQKEEIERRYQALVRDPSRGSTWEAARARLWPRYG